MTDAFITTPEGAHSKAKELGIKAYNLGCSCYSCNKEFDEIMNRKPDVIKAELSVGKQEESVLYKEIWNEAIEAAFEWLNEEANWQTWNDPKDAEKIRKLKK